PCAGAGAGPGVGGGAGDDNDPHATNSPAPTAIQRMPQICPSTRRAIDSVWRATSSPACDGAWMKASLWRIGPPTSDAPDSRRESPFRIYWPVVPAKWRHDVERANEPLAAVLDARTKKGSERVVELDASGATTAKIVE